MILNSIEFMMMNNPVRAFIQEHYEAQILKRLSSLSHIEHALEIGCGNGTGTRLIQKHFKPKKITAVDLDEKMINLAKANFSDSDIHFQVMDAAQLDFPDATFDSVFDFGIIHHIPDWQSCLDELYRVLKPGGEALIEDLSIETFETPSGRLLRALTEHPYESMFTNAGFKDGLGKAGFDVQEFQIYNPFGLIEFFSTSATKAKV